jgi:hypothetical protein
MNLNFREYMSADFESPAVLGRRTLTRLGDCIRKATADRAVLEQQGHMFIDIRYDELMADTIGVLQQLYSTLGLSFTADFGAKIKAQLAVDKATRGGGGGGGHSYSLEMFGLCKADIDAEFRVYTNTYLS